MATYRRNLSLLSGHTFGVRAVREEIRDDQNNGDVARQVGTIVI